MDIICNLQVDLNGDGVFFVDKTVLSSYSGRLRKLFSKSTNTRTNLKVIFHDFPGGVEIFELITRFCYNNGYIEIIPSNLLPLHSAALYMEMDRLLEHIEKSLEEITHWPWPDLLLALKLNQDIMSKDVGSSSVLHKCLDTLVGRLALTAETSPCPSTSSSESSGFRISCDSRSTESMKMSSSRLTWWFEDLVVLNESLVEMAVKLMVSRKFDHGTISRFLFHYQKSKFVNARSDEKCKTMEMVIEALFSLDNWSISYKGLLGILRITLNLNISKCTRSRLESMVGSRLDEATLDNLLIPSPSGVDYLYDVNLVLRLLKSFLGKGQVKGPNERTTKVSSLLDLYLAEVAPDPCLKSSKFIALATALPDFFRDCYDSMYHALDMYLEVHTNLTEEETFKICSALNYEKLSPESCIHLSNNTKFPSRSAVEAIVTHHVKLKGLVHDTNYPKSSYSSSPCSYDDGTMFKASRADESADQIVLYTGKIDIVSENEKLKAHLQGMQCRVTELEKVCLKMQAQMAKMVRGKSSNNVNSRSLPKLCS